MKNKSISMHFDMPYEDENIILVFAGDITFFQYDEIGYHTDGGFEICLIPTGKGFFKIDERTYPVIRRQLFITKEPQVHNGWSSEENPYRILYLCFKVKKPAVSSLWNRIDESLEMLNFPVAPDNYQMEVIFQRLLGEIINRENYAPDMMGNLVQQIALLTLRNFNTKGNEGPSSGQNSIQGLVASRVVHFISEHIREKITLESVSTALNYSIPYICSSFKDQTGFTIIEYYNYARLELAKEELITSCSSISDISEKYNFSSIHHFSKAFKELYKISPNTYRKAASELNNTKI